MVHEQIRDKLPYCLRRHGGAERQEHRTAGACLHDESGSLGGAACSRAPCRDGQKQAEIGEPITAATPRLSIVVLPFANLSNDPEQEYFADGITDDLTTISRGSRRSCDRSQHRLYIQRQIG